MRRKEIGLQKPQVHTMDFVCGLSQRGEKGSCIIRQDIVQTPSEQQPDLWMSTLTRSEA